MIVMKGFKKFIVEYYLESNKGMVDLDKAIVMADDLWDRAIHKDKEAEILLGKLVVMYNKRGLA